MIKRLWQKVVGTPGTPVDGGVYAAKIAGTSLFRLYLAGKTDPYPLHEVSVPNPPALGEGEEGKLYLLKISSSGIALEWEEYTGGGGGGAWVPIARHEITNGDAAADLADIFTDTYDWYQIRIRGLIPASDTSDFRWRYRDSSGIVTPAGADYKGALAYVNNAGGAPATNYWGLSAGHCLFNSALGSDTGEESEFIIDLAPRIPGIKRFHIHGQAHHSSGAVQMLQGGGYLVGSAGQAMTGLYLTAYIGNLEAGTIDVYGLTKPS